LELKCIIGEAVVATEEEMAFGRTSIGAYKYKSGVFAISNELLTDSNVAVIPLITKATGARFQRAWNLHFTKGTNSGQPQGIVPGLIAAGGTTSIAATALAADNLIDLVHSLNAAYRFGSKFMLNDVTLSAIRKLKDGDGNYLWQMGDISKGVPDTLLGYPVAVNYDMDGIATSKVSVLFGNYTSAYTIRRAGEFALRRSEEFKFDSDEVAFVSFARVDGKLLLPAAVKGLQHA
jgi:HK97 family phage major capsid protein